MEYYNNVKNVMDKYGKFPALPRFSPKDILLYIEIELTINAPRKGDNTKETSYTAPAI